MLVSATLGSLAAAAGCSLINAADDLKDAVIDSGGPVADGSAQDGGGGTTDGGTDADAAVERPAKGVIVLGASQDVDGGTNFVLTALDPATGAELPKAREAMTVSAARYDQVRDLWYVFESGGEGFFPTPTDSFFVHVRQLDTYTGEWTELQKLEIPPAVAFTHMAILANRIVYLAYAAVDGGDAAQELVTLDTTNPTAVSVYDHHVLDSSLGTVTGMLGTRLGTTGGYVSMVGTYTDTSSTPAKRFVKQTRYFVPNNGPPQLDVSGANPTLGTNPMGGSIGYGTGTVNGSQVNIIATKPFSPGGGFIATYDPANGDQLTSDTPLPLNDGNVKPIAFSDCHQMVFVVGTNSDTKLYAVPLTPGMTAPTPVNTGHSGQGVYYEPYTGTVLAPFSQGEGYSLNAYVVNSSGSTVTLVPHDDTNWAVPKDLRPLIVTTRDPAVSPCPQ